MICQCLVLVSVSHSPSSLSVAEWSPRGVVDMPLDSCVCGGGGDNTHAHVHTVDVNSV